MSAAPPPGLAEALLAALCAGGEPPRALVALLASAMHQAEQERDRRRTDEEMAELYRVPLRAWRAAVEADPQIWRASVTVRVPGKKRPVRLWRSREVEMRWQGALPRPRKRDER